MGEASDLVGKPQDVPAPKTEKAAKTPGETVIARLAGVLDDIDRAVQVKEKDLATEGDKVAAENHYKLGILRGAEVMIRRAKAMLADYQSHGGGTFEADAKNDKGKKA